jgi:hypothetical protein
MSVRIRPGKKDDAAFLARVMMLASRGHLLRGVWDLIAADGPLRVCRVAPKDPSP